PGARQHHDGCEAQCQVTGPDLAQFAELGHPQVHHDQAGNAARRVHDHEQEHQPQVQKPSLGQLGQQHKGNDHQDGTDDGAKKEGGSAQKGEEQISARTPGPDHLCGDDLEVECAQAPGNASKKARDDEGHVAHALGVVADELDAL
ncbi:Uncharacterized protein APZ42_002532, partial [Daphnia magna]